MVGRLKQTHPREALLVGTVHHRLHQAPSHALVLLRRRDGQGAHAGYSRALVQEGASNYLALPLGHHPVEARMGEEHGDDTYPHLWCGKVRGEIVLACYGGEGLVDDCPARLPVLRSSGAKPQAVHGILLNPVDIRLVDIRLVDIRWNTGPGTRALEHRPSLAIAPGGPGRPSPGSITRPR